MAGFESSELVGQALDCVRGGRLVFAGLDFRLPSGGASVLVGPNGSGKSSLLRLVAGLIAPSRGRMSWNGADVVGEREAHAARLHYVGHAEAMKPAMTARETLAFWAAMRGETDAAVVEAALRRVGLSHRMDFPGRYLSSGQRRRLALARLLAAPAPLWLLDEPTVGLDRAGVAALEAIIAEHRAAGGMVMLATHIPVALGGDERHLDLGDFAADADAILAAMTGGVA